jgi:hypothetical protein
MELPRRVPKGGDVISDYWLPENVSEALLRLWAVSEISPSTNFRVDKGRRLPLRSLHVALELSGSGLLRP